MKTNEIAISTKHYISACSTVCFNKNPEIINLDFLVDMLPGVKMKDGFVLECMTPGALRNWGRTMIYARDINVSIPDVDDFRRINDEGVVKYFFEGFYLYKDKLDVEFTEDGIWSAFLLHMAWHFLPLFWHARYSERIMITVDKGKFKPIGPLFWIGDHKALRNAIKRCDDEMLIPSVKIVRNNEAEIYYSYWSEWGGLYRENILAKKNDVRVSFVKMGSVTLFEHESDIRF